MRNLLDNRWFAFVDLFLVLISGAIWMTRPEWGIWFMLIALLPWGIKIISGRFPFQRTFFDGLVVIFLITAWFGYWAAYDKSAAWNKAWLIVTAVLLYYNLISQPMKNWNALFILFFCVGIGVSVYYFLTHDFIVSPRKLEFVNRIGSHLMELRPKIEWRPIHPNYVGGLGAIMMSFIVFPTLVSNKKIRQRSNLFYVFAFIGLGIILFALFMTTSRGVVMAIASGLGLWLLWKFANLIGFKYSIKKEIFFPSVVLVYLFLIIIFLYLGPANSGSIFSASYSFGNGSRAELLSRSLYLLWDYPFTGGGLGAFPGLYSQYLLNIPFFNVPNSHNMFLDVAIEQGLFGGLSFGLMYLTSIWLVSRSLALEKSIETQILYGALLFSLIIAVVHGMVDDYLFNGNGAVLSLFLVGFSVLVIQREGFDKPLIHKLNRQLIGIGLFFIIGMLIFFSKNILSEWYANLGAVSMSQVEVDGFPNNGWAGQAIMSKLSNAETTLHVSVQLNPNNRTANQRLGMISMLDQNFETASEYLEAAYKVAPGHRGIIKSLGYCYVWLGDFKKAKLFLSRVPEAEDELDTYVWWWKTQGRDDLSDNAILAIRMLKNAADQP